MPGRDCDFAHKSQFVADLSSPGLPGWRLPSGFLSWPHKLPPTLHYSLCGLRSGFTPLTPTTLCDIGSEHGEAITQQWPVLLGCLCGPFLEGNTHTYTKVSEQLLVPHMWMMLICPWQSGAQQHQGEAGVSVDLSDWSNLDLFTVCKIQLT